MPIARLLDVVHVHPGHDLSMLRCDLAGDFDKRPGRGQCRGMR